ncbi:HD-GYP domain-containing protein [Desulfovibrio oxyclinae]|jgi:response regulator RpfG family c-di-GMP phosphodiesterase|uniref:HD-GYP domain-containing protein n=1 Tax=Desulfovibrio oxyclinae TaxID=63560 RepID=UPI00036BE596|nr:HD domain-containing phosphohydrolase [Desulfovibrio oxyclinae]
MSDSTDQLREQYLQISRNLLSTFPEDVPPVRLYEWNELLERVDMFHEAEKVMSPERRREAQQTCDEGRLYLHRDDYRTYAKLLSKNLGLVLLEDDLDNRDVAETFFRALVEKMGTFYDQPTHHSLREVRADLGVLCEYIWTNPCRIGFLVRTLGYGYSLEIHTVNTIFIGLGLRVMAAWRDLQRLELGSLALGLALHDVGMIRVPGFIRDKPGVLMHNERQSMKKHPDTGMMMLARLKVKDPVVEECVQHHHERVNGTGYPGRLRGEAVGLNARICGLADAFCASVGERPYHGAKEMEKAVRQFSDDPSYDSRLAGLLEQLVLRREEPCPLPFVPRSGPRT